MDAIDVPVRLGKIERISTQGLLMQTTLRSLLIAALALASFSAQAQWKSLSQIDAMTDKEVRAAAVMNADGYNLAIMRNEKGAVWMSVGVPKENMVLLDNKAVMVRFDRHPPHTMSPQSLEMTRLVGPMWNWKPKSISTVVWHGLDGDGRNDFINQVMTSSQALVRIPLHSGGSQDLVFTMEGARTAVAQALNIPENPDPAVESQATAYREAFNAALKTCSADGARRECTQRVARCHGQSGKDPAKLQSCVAQ